MNIPEIARKIISGEAYKIKITIPEGFNLKQIETALGQGYQNININLDKFQLKALKKDLIF